MFYNNRKLGPDEGQPGILTGDTGVSHTHPSGSCGTYIRPTEKGPVGPPEVWYPAWYEGWY